MVTTEQTTLYRNAVSLLLRKYRNALYVSSGRKSFPTDASIASYLGISATALSSISRCCSSMSGITLRAMLTHMSVLMDSEDFLGCLSAFVLDV